MSAKASKGPRKARFRVGQVVMIKNSFGSYPVKLAKSAGVGIIAGQALGLAWWDTLHNAEYERDMRPLSKREQGGK